MVDQGYIMASRKHGTLYTGVTSDLLQRVFEHKNDIKPGFTSKYGVKRLVWYENHDNIIVAIAREKRVKRWRRHWKIQLIEKDNPDWEDLFETLL
jgi:putative endonuclease